MAQGVWRDAFVNARLACGEAHRFPDDLRRDRRSAGYDRVLRAGQSMGTLVLSRSREHGLRKGQPSVSVEAHRDGTMDIVVDDGRGSLEWVQRDPDGMTLPVYVGGPGFHRHKMPEIVYCKELIDALENLRQQPID